MAVIDIKKTVFSVIDGTPTTPLSVSLKLGEGTLTYTETKPRQYILDRGVIDTVRDGDQTPMDVKFGFLWEFLKSDTGGPVTIEEALKQKGNASAWVSSATDTCEPYAVDIKVVYGPNCATIKNETYLFPDYRYETLEHDFKAGMVTSSGKCNAVEPVITRTT